MPYRETPARSIPWVWDRVGHGAGQRELCVWVLMPVVLCRGSQAAVGAPGRHRRLEQELRELQAAEWQLDELIQTCSAQLRLLTEDPANQQYPLCRMGWGWRGGDPAGSRHGS